MKKPNQTEPLLTYVGQMLWLISAQLHAMSGGADYPVPDVMSILGGESGGAGWPDRDALVERLKGGAS